VAVENQRKVQFSKDTKDQEKGKVIILLHTYGLTIKYGSLRNNSIFVFFKSEYEQFEVNETNVAGRADQSDPPYILLQTSV
jgi:hypothetical protein